MLARFLRSVTPALLAVLLPAPLPAQGDPLTPAEARKRLAEGRPLWDARWKVDDQGELLMSPSPDVGGPSDRFAPFLPQDISGVGWRANFGLIGNLSLLCTGPRDLASLGDAELVLLADGVDTSDAALRRLLVTPVTEPVPGRARRTALQRILAVRLLQERGAEAARPELQAIARNAETDPFLAQAARDALLTLDGRSPERSQVPDAVLGRVPAAADLILFVDQARVPPSFFLPRLARAAAMESIVVELEAGRDGLSPAMLAGAMQISESTCRAPFELARRFGNARMDWSLLALEIRERRVAFWFEAAGRFEHERIAASLADAGLEVEKGATTRVTGLPFQNVLEVSAERLHVHGSDLTAEPDAGRAKALGRAGLGGDAAVWLHVPGNSWLLEQVDLPAKPRAVTVTLTFGPVARAVLRTEHELPLHAKGVVSLLDGFRRQGLRVLEDLPGSPGIERIADALEGATLTAEGTTMIAAIDLSGVTPDDVSALLIQLVRQGRLW